MSRYIYSRTLRKWCNLDWGQIEAAESELPIEKINQLKDARKNNKFIIVKHRYYSLYKNVYMYIDIEDYKLNLCNGKKFYFVTKEKFVTSRTIFTIDEIINKKLLLSLPEDAESSVDFILTHKEVQEDKFDEENVLKNLSDSAKLAYTLYKGN